MANERKDWVARCDTFFKDKNLSPKFSSAQECAEYIAKELKVVEYLCRELEDKIRYEFDEYRDHPLASLKIKFNDYIRPYNLKQKRFANGFDF